MSRKFDRKKKIIELTSRVLSSVTTDPSWIAGNFVRKKPRYIPFFLWKRIVRFVVRFPKRPQNGKIKL